MNKTMYVPKGQECRFENLTCDRIVVNGSLHVDSRLKTKHISGKGFIYAKWITATSITANTVDADTIATDTLVATHINAYDVHAVKSMAVSSLITAAFVKAGHITYANAEIGDLQTDEAVVLTPKRRGLLRTLFASYIRSKWASLTSKELKSEPAIGSNGEEAQETTAQHAETPTDAAQREFDESLAEAERMLEDPEFLRLRAMYKLSRETGEVWQLVPKKEPTDRVVAEFTAA